jgi:serine/threonine protein kinase
VKRAPKIRQADGKIDPVQESLFQREVAAMAAISSPYIVTIVDAFEDSNYQYIVMEYCENGNLRDYLRQRVSSQSPLSEQVCFC